MGDMNYVSYCTAPEHLYTSRSLSHYRNYSTLNKFENVRVSNTERAAETL